MLNRFKKIASITMIVLVVAFTTSCEKKYEDGPRFNLKSKAKRLSGLWKVTKQVQDGDEFLNNHTIQLDLLESAKDPEGQFNSYTLYTSDGSGDEYKTEGLWELSDDKTKLIFYWDKVEFDTTGTGQAWQTITVTGTGEYKILRLTGDELWMDLIDGSSDLHLEYAKQ